MAQSDRFYFWRGYYDAMEYLTDEEAGKLIRAICAYAFDGAEPDFSDNRLMQVAWTMVANSAQESVEMGRKARESGKTGGRPPKKTTPKRVPKTPPLTTPKTPPESVGYSNVPQPSVGDGVAVAADAAPLRPDKVMPDILPDGSTVLPNGIVIPPQRAD